MENQRTEEEKQWMQKNILSKEIMKRMLVVILSLAIALVSIFVVAKRATSPDCYKNTIQSIDEKKAIVMAVTTAAAATSTALAAIPGDATTPIANQIMNISSYLLIVVCALVLEKSLLTVLGYLSFNILIPIACVLFAISMFAKRSLLKILSLKIVVFALVLSTVIPFSLKISDLIYESNMSTVEDLNSKVEGISDETKDEKETGKTWWDKLKDKVEDGVSKAGEQAKELVNNFIDVIALFVITYCAIPIIVFLVVIWFIKFLFNITIPTPSKETLQVFRKKESGTKPETQEHEHGI